MSSCRGPDDRRHAEESSHHRLYPDRLHHRVRGGTSRQRHGHLGVHVPDQEEEPVVHLHGQPGAGRPALRHLDAPEDFLPLQRQRLDLRRGAVQGSDGLLLREHVLLRPLHHLPQRAEVLGGGSPSVPAEEEQQTGHWRLRGHLGVHLAHHHAAVPLQPHRQGQRPQHHHLPRRHRHRGPARPVPFGQATVLLLHLHGDGGVPGPLRGDRCGLRSVAQSSGEQHGGQQLRLKEPPESRGADRDGSGDVPGVFHPQ